MDEYRAWLEKQVEDANKLLEKNVNLKCYGVADYYDIKLIVYKDCLDTLKQLEKHQEQDVSFSELKVGKKYNFTLKDDDFSEVITIIAKGCDNKGRYVWYSFESSPNVSFRGYESEYAAVKYFKEVG